MSQALTVPNSTPFGGECIDAVVETIQSALSGLPWLQYSLGRVKPQLREGKVEPWIIKDETGEYYPAYPNDQLVSFSCLYAHDDEKYEDDNVFVRRSLSVIVWVNLKTVVELSVEEMKRAVRLTLRELNCVMLITGSKDQTVSGAGSIYPDFDVSGLAERYMTHPYGAFRIETVVHYADLCY